MKWLTLADPLPISPKRVAKALEAAGWKWNCSLVEDHPIPDEGLVTSLVIRGHNPGKTARIGVRWEKINDGKMELAYSAVQDLRRYPKSVTLTQALDYINARPSKMVSNQEAK